ncbi:MAG: Si-specific NAD(P)(+) transhydrogenase [Flavobacteriales bacterium]|jgi:NAD(P) transhydrogenase|nr:Si-specific NAD(P)(+) transhydrogenase [Flavobacteriales bacterium]
MTENLQVDVTIIGSGPSGQKAAIQAAKLGKSVIIIEKDSFPGGVCLNTGTIPSKTLRESILDLTDFHQRSFYGKDHKLSNISINDLNFRLNKVIEVEQNLILRQFKKNKIQLLYGAASFDGPNDLNVTDKDHKILYRIKSDCFVIATGSKPRNPIEVPFDKDVILDSTRLLSIDTLPKTMLVLGGGIIGSEYASFFSLLGTKVTVIDKKTHMLPLLDSEIGIHLQTALSDLGLEFWENKTPRKISRINNKARVEFTDDTSIESDVLLYALGREANVDSLNINNAGIEVSQRGYIPVNPLFQTAQTHIYAVGDVIGGPSLASTGMEQGRLAMRHACGRKTNYFPELFPLGIYTIPEISTCGATEEALKEKGIHYEVGRAYYYEIARSHISGDSVGLFKILFHSETLEILGIHVIGRGATEVIHIGQVAMSFNAKIDYFINHVFNYPTYAEGFRIAALNGYNKVAHKL